MSNVMGWTVYAMFVAWMMVGIYLVDDHRRWAAVAFAFALSSIAGAIMATDHRK